MNKLVLNKITILDDSSSDNGDLIDGDVFTGLEKVNNDSKENSSKYSTKCLNAIN